MPKKPARPARKPAKPIPSRRSARRLKHAAQAGRPAAVRVADGGGPGDALVPSAIVAVGASAGGLEAFSQVLEHLDRNPDLAFIFVQHLSPAHSSALPELLGPRTNLSVVQATNGIAIEPNHVYVIPPNVHMDVVDGRLHLLPRPTDRSQFNPIDFFFQSVAR
jgi:two-component system CheB/CheR fusion protein